MSKNVAVIASWIHPIRQKHLLDWYDDLGKESNSNQLFLGSKDKKIPYALNYKINSRLEKLKYDILNIFEFKHKINKLKKIQPLVNYNPDIIHLLTSNVFENIEPILETKRIKLIVSFRGYDINVFPKQSEANKILTQKIFKKADVLHFISENLKDTAIDLGAPTSKCKVIYRSIRNNSKVGGKRNSIENGKLIILSVGRLVWEKGYLYALETIAILKNKGFDFEYQIAGNGIDYNMLVYHTYRLNIQDRVKFLGELDREEIQKKLLTADIYFQPSLTEALSVALIEASYFGLPIVSSNIGGIPEIIKCGVSGLLNNSCNPEEYAESLIRLINDKDLRIRMGNSAHNFILENFSREREINEWIQLYGTLI